MKSNSLKFISLLDKQIALTNFEKNLEVILLTKPVFSTYMFTLH